MFLAHSLKSADELPRRWTAENRGGGPNPRSWRRQRARKICMRERRGRAAAGAEGRWRARGAHVCEEFAGGGGDDGAQARTAAVRRLVRVERDTPPTVMTDETHAS
jgi:hypothetical protein